MEKLIRVGTRDDALEMLRAETVIGQIRALAEELEFEVVPIKETAPEEAILTYEVDIAVCSAERVPASLSEELTIVGIPKREDPREVFITRKNQHFSREQELVIAASNSRRKIQAERMDAAVRRRILCENLPGDMANGIKRLFLGDYDGIIMGAADMKTLGLHQEEKLSYQYLECSDFIPVGGQGTVAVIGRLTDELSRTIGKISDADTAMCLVTERRIQRMLEADSGEPVGVHARIKENEIHIVILYYRKERMETIYGHASVMEAAYLSQQLMMELMERYC